MKNAQRFAATSLRRFLQGIETPRRRAAWTCPLSRDRWERERGEEKCHSWRRFAAAFPARKANFKFGLSFYSLAVFTVIWHRNFPFIDSFSQYWKSPSNHVGTRHKKSKFEAQRFCSRTTFVCFVIDTNLASINFNSIYLLTLSNSRQTIKVLMAFRVVQIHI